MKTLIAFCLAAFAAVPAFAQNEDFTAKLFTSKGTVEKFDPASAEWTRIKAPQKLYIGDKIRTGKMSRAEIYLRYGAKVRLGPNAEFVIKKVSPQENSVELVRGKLQAWVRKFAKRGFTVRTPSAVCAVRGTVFEVAVDDDGATVWSLFSGRIEISDSRSHTVNLAPNQRVAVSQDGEITKPSSLPASLQPPTEPPAIPEEKAEIKAESAAAAMPPVPGETPKEAPSDAVVEPLPGEEAPATEPVLVEPPPTTVIETQTVTEDATRLSESNP